MDMIQPWVAVLKTIWTDGVLLLMLLKLSLLLPLNGQRA